MTKFKTQYDPSTELYHVEVLTQGMWAWYGEEVFSTEHEAFRYATYEF